MTPEERIEHDLAREATRTLCGDKTVRWSPRSGDYLLWITAASVLASDHESAWTICDFWQMRDGDFVTITNRWVDLPGWFELHPAEVANQASVEMLRRLAAGYQPKEPTEGSNLWRVKAGDRLVWVTTADSSRPVREILDCRACTLVVGENSNPTTAVMTSFGVPAGHKPSPAAAAAMRAGLKSAAGLGVPREWAEAWTFGA